MGKLIVIHPDLGIGGAERLIVDASKAIQERNHQVTIYTGYHDPNHCFGETIDGTLEVRTICRWLPRSIFGRLHALMAYIKIILIAFYIILTQPDYDTILCDQVSACIPFLKLYHYILRKPKRIVFYCHFPDQLLTCRNSFLKYLYRVPLDFFEEWSTGLADIILVNSRFTARVVQKTFKSLAHRRLLILNPCVDVDYYTKSASDNDEKAISSFKLKFELPEDHFIFLSLNRIERKKNLELAIEAFGEFKNIIEDGTGKLMKAHLIVSGGYDERLIDSVKYYEELKQLVDKLKLRDQVSFVMSPSDKEKILLLQISHAVLYTPSNEHFGIVPLEAMAMSKPVISCNSGGPLETIEHNVSGYLCDAESLSFASSMIELYYHRDRSVKFGEAGYNRVREHFSYGAFGEKLKDIVFYKL